MEKTLVEINIYPIKSLGGISLTDSLIEERGLKYDRRWMLVDEHGQFITQRKYPELSLLSVSLLSDSIKIGKKGSEYYDFDLNETTGKKLNVAVWDSICESLEVSKTANNYFSDYLNKKVALVYMPEDSKRYVDRDYAKDNEIVSFADGFPILLIGQGSLNNLNEKLEVPVLMNRFRPNLVVSTSVPFDEDSWDSFSIGNTNFKAVKPCSRCIMTTIDPFTGKKGSEPLKTLSSYRTKNNKVMFGQNVLVGNGDRTIKLGDTIKINSRRKI